MLLESLKTTNNTSRSDKEYLIRNEDAFDIELKKSEGSFLYDANDRRYIDFLSGWCVGNIGWGNKLIKKAIKEYDGPDYVYPHFLYKPWADLGELLAEIIPGNLTKCFRTTGGSESVDCALQIAMAYTGRKRFLSLEGSYHGNLISTISIADSEAADQLQTKLQGSDKIKTPLTKNRLNTIENLLKKKETAALIMEPISCNLSVLIPDFEFMSELAKLCKEYNTLLIMDEVATGFGRTGKMFAFEHYDLEPDIICLSKAITGGYAGLGVTITTNKIAKAVKEKVSIYSTYGWHPLSVHVALTCLNYMKDNKDTLLENVNKISQVFKKELKQIQFKQKPEIRIKGLAISLEFEDKKYAEKVQKQCMKNGLLFVNQENSLVFFPALNIKKEVVYEAIDILKESV